MCYTLLMKKLNYKHLYTWLINETMLFLWWDMSEHYLLPLRKFCRKFNIFSRITAKNA